MLDLHSFYCRCCMLAYVQAALYDACKRRRTVKLRVERKTIILLTQGTGKCAMLTQATGDQALVVQCQLVLLPLA